MLTGLAQATWRTLFKNNYECMYRPMCAQMYRKLERRTKRTLTSNSPSWKAL